MNEAEAEAVWRSYLESAYRVLGRGTTYNDQLDSYGHYLFGERYHGTYPSDKIPNLTHKQPYAIINNHTSGQPGEHWIAIARDINGSTLVFDSYGRPIKSLLNDLTPLGRYRETDPDPNQTKEQTDCGSRCMAFLRLFNDYGSDVAMLI